MTSVFKLKNPFDYRSPDTLAELLKNMIQVCAAHFGEWHIETDRIYLDLISVMEKLPIKKVEMMARQPIMLELTKIQN